MIRRAVIAALLISSVASASAPGDYTGPLTVHVGRESNASEIVMLRPSPVGRVRIAGSAFVMGSSPLEILDAVQLCRREPLGSVLVSIPPTAFGTPETVSLHCAVDRFQIEGFAHPVTVSPFWIDRTEVRVADYMRCVSIGDCNSPGFSQADVRFANPEFPVTQVTWDDAQAYCKFARGRLPTEAEWELVARGIEHRIFPWGNVYNPHLANHGSIALDRTDATDGFAGLAPVGAIRDGRTPAGVLDLAGNVAEWVADLAEPLFDDAGNKIADLQPYCPQPRQHMIGNHCCYGADTWNGALEKCCPPTAPNAPDDPLKCSAEAKTLAMSVNPVSTQGSRRIARGGSYLTGADSLRNAARRALYATDKLPDVGFRCASSD